MKKSYFKNYVSKVEDKYVFNLSSIFWHLFIALASVGIFISILLFFWSLIPPFHKNVEKQAYPTEKQYPEPVKVTINELLLQDAAQEETLQPKVLIDTVVENTEPKVIEDTKGKDEYVATLNTLKVLIPPAKYSWSGSGEWSYPYGQQYWTYYKQEKYRQWNVSEPGLEDKLISSYRTSNAKNYTEKKKMLDGYIIVLKPMKEEIRLTAIQYLLNQTVDSVGKNIAIYQALAKVVSKMSSETSAEYISQLASFGNSNPNEGVPFIDYISSIIDKFNPLQRTEIIGGLINSYYNFFSQDLKIQKEATDLFMPLLKGIKAEIQYKSLIRYYGLYVRKNQNRDVEIAQIKNEYQQSINAIEQQFIMDQAIAAMDYQETKIKKAEYRYKSLLGVGGGIVLIVLIGTILAFLSIQRSVRKIEEKITN